MKKRIAILLGVIVAAVLVVGAMAQAGAAAQSNPSAASVQKDYRLDSSGWQVEGVSSGSSYHLEASTAPNDGPCCCVSLPCIRK